MVIDLWPRHCDVRPITDRRKACEPTEGSISRTTLGAQNSSGAHNMLLATYARFKRVPRTCANRFAISIDSADGLCIGSLRNQRNQSNPSSWLVSSIANRTMTLPYLPRILIRGARIQDHPDC